MISSGTDQIHECVFEVINDVGIPHHLVGYNYVASAISLAANDPDKLNYMTKELYPGVAELFNTTYPRVERAIRHAVEVAFDNGDWNRMYKYFGNSISPKNGRPTNSQFIAALSQVVRRKIISSENCT